MIKNLKTMLQILATVILFMLCGCGGGGGGGGNPIPTTISGTASKGIIYPGTVSIYAVDAAGAKASTPLTTVATGSNGQFNASIGSYSGPIVMEATGTYTDEAKGTAVVIDANRPMRAAINAVAPGVSRRFAITPLTDLAYSLASPLTAQNIAAANARVSSLFKISDITAIEPVQPTNAAMGVATIGQQTYTLALAGLSQLAMDNNPGVPASFSQIDTLLNSFKTNMAASPTAGLGTANVQALAAALTTVTSGTLTGYAAATTALTTAGTTQLTLILSVSNIPNGKLVGGIEGTITLPAGTDISLDPAMNGSVLPGSFSLTTASKSFSANSYIAPVFKFSLINGTGLSGGDFATLTVNVAGGLPIATDFVLSDVKVLDLNASTMAATVTLK